MESWLLTVAVTVLLHLFRLLHPHTLCSLYTHCVASRELQMAWTWLEAAAGQVKNEMDPLPFGSTPCRLLSSLVNTTRLKIENGLWMDGRGEHREK